MEIDIAIDEIFGNIAYYAYTPKTGEATVQVEIKNFPERLELTFIDKGIPYNPLENKDPDVTLDIEKRKIAIITEEIIKAYKMEDKSVLKIDNLEKIKMPEKFENIVKYEIKRRDIDVNKHLHNLYYLDLAYEALPEDIYNNKRPFNNVKIVYKKEIKLGDIVNCEYSKVEGKHVIIIKDQEEQKVHAIIELY